MIELNQRSLTKKKSKNKNAIVKSKELTALGSIVEEQDEDEELEGLEEVEKNELSPISDHKV